MQCALNAYYVAVSVYGFLRWSKAREEPRAIAIWPLRLHAAAWAGVLLLSLVSAHLLQRETQAAWPFLDSFTTWGSLFVTWLVARMKLENWLCWIAIDSILAFLFAEQHLYGFAALNLAYVGICIGGFIGWLRIYRAQPA